MPPGSKVLTSEWSTAFILVQRDGHPVWGLGSLTPSPPCPSWVTSRGPEGLCLWTWLQGNSPCNLECQPVPVWEAVTRTLYVALPCLPWGAIDISQVKNKNSLLKLLSTCWSQKGIDYCPWLPFSLFPFMYPQFDILSPLKGFYTESLMSRLPKAAAIPGRNGTECRSPDANKAELCSNQAKICLQKYSENEIWKGFCFSFFLKRIIWTSIFFAPLYGIRTFPTTHFS